MSDRDRRQQQLADDARLFRDPETGQPMLLAAAIHRRSIADLFYLSRVRMVGQAQAGVETCERYGHERGTPCSRCAGLTRVPAGR